MNSNSKIHQFHQERIFQIYSTDQIRRQSYPCTHTQPKSIKMLYLRKATGDCALSRNLKSYRIRLMSLPNLLTTFTHTPTHQLSPNQMPLPEGTHQVCFDPSSLNSLRAEVLLYSQYECTNYRHSIGKLQGLQLFFPSMGVVRGEGGSNRLLTIIEATHSCLLLFQQVSLQSRHIPKYTPV